MESALSRQRQLLGPVLRARSRPARKSETLPRIIPHTLMFLAGHSRSGFNRATLLLNRQAPHHLSGTSGTRRFSGCRGLSRSGSRGRMGKTLLSRREVPPPVAPGAYPHGRPVRLVRRP